MRKFTAVAVLAVVVMFAGSASAGMISGSYELTGSSGSTSDPVDLTAEGPYAWAIFADAVDDDDNDVYEPTEWKSGGPFIGITGDYSGTGGNNYGNPTQTDAIWQGQNHEKSEYFEWTDGTNTPAGIKTNEDTLRMQNPLGWVGDSGRRDLIINGDDGGTPMDPSDDTPALDPDYPTTLADYLADTDYNVGTLTITVPVEAGSGTAKVYFGTRRVSWIMGAQLAVDGELWESDLAGDGDFVSIGNKTNNVLSIDFEADTAQDLLITFTGQEVDSDTNRRFDVQAVAVTPEPATMSLLALGGLGVLIRRKRS
jgi:hypothetical protein